MTKLLEKKTQKYQLGGKFRLSKLYKPNLSILTSPEYIKSIIPISAQEKALKTFLTPEKSLDTSTYPRISKKIIDGDNYNNQLSTDIKSQLDTGIESQLDTNIPILDEHPLQKSAGAIKPLIALASGYYNLQQLKKTRDAANNLSTPRVDAAVVPNRPIQALSPEIKDLYLKNIANLKTQKTSDSTLNSINDQTLNINKMAAMDKLTAAEVENLFKERARHDQIEGVNAQESVKARNEQSKFSSEIANRKATNNAEYEGKKQDFFNKWIEEALIIPMDKRIAYNMGRETLQNTENWERLQDQIINEQNRINKDPENTDAKTRLDDLLKAQSSLSKTKLPNYNGSARYIFS